MNNLKIFKSNLFKIDRKSYKNIGMYNIGYITIKKINDCESSYSVNPLYFWLIMQTDIFKKKMKINTSSLTLHMKTKSY